MPWLKLDDGFHDHPKVVWVGRDARDLHLRVLAWCTRYQATGGIFSAEVVRTAAAAEGLTGQEAELTRRLLSCPPGWDSGRGLWVEGPTPDSYQVHDFDAYRPPMTASERTAKWKKRKGDGAGDAQGDAKSDGAGDVPLTQKVTNLRGTGRSSNPDPNSPNPTSVPHTRVRSPGPPTWPGKVPPAEAARILAQAGAPRLVLPLDRQDTPTGLDQLHESVLVQVCREKRASAADLERVGRWLNQPGVWSHLRSGISARQLLGKPEALAEALDLSRAWDGSPIAVQSFAPQEPERPAMRTGAEIAAALRRELDQP